MDCYCDTSGPEWLRENDIGKAKKEHTCSCCNEKINKGEKYKKIVGQWEGYIETYKYCEFCIPVYQEVLNSNMCFFYDCMSFHYAQLWDKELDCPEPGLYEPISPEEGF